MPRLDVVVSSPVRRSFRVAQVAGIFDIPLERKVEEHFKAELPDQAEPWQIGLIVGPSGSGKTTIARKGFGKSLWSGTDWPGQGAVLDGFPRAMPARTIVEALTAVGFSSPPSWLKPYHVLSTGEKFRCDLARALVEPGPSGLVVFDEFTSVVDRTVAKFTAAAVSKAIRAKRIAARFVAVSCHYDVADWLEPDWVLDMASGRLARGRLRRRPSIDLDVAAIHTLRGKTYPREQWQARPGAFDAPAGRAQLRPEAFGPPAGTNLPETDPHQRPGNGEPPAAESDELR